MTKKIILIDLDGVLNEYSGNFIENHIPNMRQGAQHLLENISKHYRIKIFTTRNKIQTVKWLIENKIDKFVEDVTDIKEPAWLYIDDRCISFSGNYTELSEKINNFKPWFKE